jgi:hypothetical protein
LRAKLAVLNPACVQSSVAALVVLSVYKEIQNRAKAKPWQEFRNRSYRKNELRAKLAVLNPARCTRKKHLRRAGSHKEVCSQTRNCCVENKKIPPQIEKSVGGQLDKEEFIKLFYIILRTEANYFSRSPSVQWTIKSPDP